MVKKIKKYAKFIVCVALIMGLIAPSYAALSASDGSAFVTKAEFDSALADFNARLTTFEAGINSKIDSQVTSYLDRNGIWNGKKQDILCDKGIMIFDKMVMIKHDRYDKFRDDSGSDFNGETYGGAVEWPIFVTSTEPIKSNNYVFYANGCGYFGTGYYASEKIFTANKSGLCVLNWHYGYRSTSDQHFKAKFFTYGGSGTSAGGRKQIAYVGGGNLSIHPMDWAWGMNQYLKIIETSSSKKNIFDSRDMWEGDCVASLPAGAKLCSTRDFILGAFDRNFNTQSHVETSYNGTVASGTSFIWNVPAPQTTISTYCEQFFVSKGNSYHFSYATNAFTEGVYSTRLYSHDNQNMIRGGVKITFDSAQVY